MEKQKIAIVTGGTSGIGQAITELFIRNGIKVIVIAKNRKRLKQLRQKFGKKIFIYTIDLSEPKAITKKIKPILSKFQKIHFLVNNAGICQYGNLSKVSFKRFYQTLSVNLISHVLLTKAIVEQMTKNHTKGAIVNIGSINSFRGSKIQIEYSISKAGIHSFTQSLAKSVGSKGIRVNTVCPGVIPTRMNYKQLQNRQTIKQRLEAIPLKRFGTPQEVANAVYFLVSDKATYITGTKITVDGGWTC